MAPRTSRSSVKDAPAGAIPDVEDPIIDGDAPVEGDEITALPEPKPVAGVVIQDNVSTPGVQRTILPDGTVQEFGEALDKDDPEDVEVVDDDVAPDPDEPAAGTTPDPEDVEVPLTSGGGWINVPHQLATIDIVQPADPDAAYTVTFDTDTDDETQTCITVADAPADLTEAALVVTFNEVPAT